MYRDILFIGGSLLAYIVGALLILFISVVIYATIDVITGDAIGYFERIMGKPEPMEREQE